MLVGLRVLALLNDGIRYSLFPKSVRIFKYLEREGIKVNFSAALPGTPVPSNAVDLMSSALIMLNGHERFAPRPQTYFRLVQPYECHTRIPDDFIYLYSFGLRPEEHQPSGTVNMSRIDNAQLKFDLTNTSMLPGGSGAWSGQVGRIAIYATNYNVLRIMSGMGGLNITGLKSSEPLVCKYLVDKPLRILQEMYFLFCC